MNEPIKKKWWQSALGPALLSALVVPGAGQFANKDYKKGVGFFVGFMATFLWFSKVITEQISTSLTGTPDDWIKDPVAFQSAVMNLVNKNTDMFLTFYLLILVLWGYSVVDAYLVAKRPRPLPQPDHETPDSLD